MSPRKYDQFCPIAGSLDAIGERWTLLILRDLLAGPKRYSDFRDTLPGIATNLLSDRLRHLAALGLIEQVEVPPPVARTMYRLTERGWKRVPPVLQALAGIGFELLPAVPVDIHPFAGYLAVLLGFDAHRAAQVDESYRITVDGSSFDVGVRRGSLSAPSGEPAVELQTTARGILGWRAGTSKASNPFEVRGPAAATSRFLAVFGLQPSKTVVPV
ncbi:MAG TPA: helix-turn-helix domain-containing protein [Acidimicrobiales bacterium]|jgi:DNA-binding HxlR family transcriptional regulator